MLFIKPGAYSDTTRPDFHDWWTPTLPQYDNGSIIASGGFLGIYKRDYTSN